MNKKSVVALIVLSLCLVGCKSTKSPYIVEHPEITEDGAPYWTVLTPISNERFYGVGMGDLSTLQNSKLRAEALAKDEISRQVSTIVDSSVKNYFQEADGFQSSFDRSVFENFSYQVTNVTLQNVIVENNYTDSEGKFWVIASYDKSNLEDAYKSVGENLKRNAERQMLSAEKEIELLKEKNKQQMDIYKDNAIALAALKAAYEKTLAEKEDLLEQAKQKDSSIDLDTLIASYEKVYTAYQKSLTE
ncbi:MAG: hypothetical protein ACRQFF_04850 [Sphaerochaeta sp.]